MKKYIGISVLIILMIGGFAWSQTGPGSVSNPYPIPWSYLSTDGTFASNSDAKVPSEKAIKTYVGSSAPSSAAKILTAQAEASLSAEVNLGALTTGLLKITVADGVATPSTATSGSDYCPATSGSAVLKGNGSGGTATATSGTDYAAPVSATSIASSATPTPAVGTAGAEIRYIITALAEAPTFGAPTGTPVNGQLLWIRIKDDGTARALAWNAAYAALTTGYALPTTTKVGETAYFKFKYDSTATKWQIVYNSQNDFAGSLKIGTALVEATAASGSLFIRGYGSVIPAGEGLLNTGFGYLSLISLTTGYNNAAFGDGSGYGITNGYGNTAVGHQSMFAGPVGGTPDVEGLYNTGCGYKTLYSLTTGVYNTAVGMDAQNLVTIGAYNTSVGADSMFSTTSAQEGVAVGYRALINNTTGHQNIAIGKSSLGATTDGLGNIGLGYQSGLNSTGSKNIYIGWDVRGQAGEDQKLYIDCSNTTDPLIGGDFANRTVDLNIYKLQIARGAALGGLYYQTFNVAADITASAAVTITLNIPSGAKLDNVQLRVDSALAAGETWDAAWDDGATVQAIVSGAAVAQNTKVNKFFDPNANSPITDATTNIAITKNGGGAFTAQGTIRAVGGYWALDALDSL